MSEREVDLCAGRIRDLATRDRFLRMMKRADELIDEAAELRRKAWIDFSRATGEPR